MKKEDDTETPVMHACEHDAHVKAIAEGKKAPFFHHAGNYKVDLGAIPLWTEIGTTAVLAILKK